jgi:hypothetical protein
VQSVFRSELAVEFGLALQNHGTGVNREGTGALAATFRPVRADGDAPPIWSGGRSNRALACVGRLTDGYHASRSGSTTCGIGGPKPFSRARERSRWALAARICVRPGGRPDGRYSLCGARPSTIAELFAWAEIGVDEFAAVFNAVEPAAIEGGMETFHRDVVGPFRKELATRAAPSPRSEA